MEGSCEYTEYTLQTAENGANDPS
jgi:hypothetical protein